MPFGFRPDADRVKDLPPTRAIMPFIMPTRSQSMVFFEMSIDAAKLDAFLADARARTGLKITVLHMVVAALTRIFAERPRLNRFVAGGRIWQRRGIWISFSAKTEKSDKGSVVALKRLVEPNESLVEIVRKFDEVVGGSRSGKRDQTDKELALALALPAFMTAFIVNMLKRLDRWGLMPRFMVDGDPLFASVFIANMGSIGMDAPFHHLYEWGNIPLFCAIGRERDGKIPLRWTFDERVEDGLYCLKGIEIMRELLEEPAAHFTLPASAAPSPLEQDRGALSS